METLNKKIMYIWMVSSIFFGSLISLGIFGITYVFTDLLYFLTVPLVLILPPLMAVYSFFRYRNWGFEVREDHLYVEYGVLRKVSMMIPYVRVQHIDTNRGPLERIVGLASLRIYTAGSKGADIRLPGLIKERAENMQDDLKEKAIESEKGFDAV